MVGVFGDLSNIVADEAYHAEPTVVNRGVAMTAVILWILSAIVDLTRSLIDSHNRRRVSAPIQTSLIPSRDPSRAFSYSMLGALLFMAANFCYLGAEAFCWYEPDFQPRVCTLLEFFGGLLFVFNSFALFAEYRQRKSVPLGDASFGELVDETHENVEEQRFEREFNRTVALDEAAAAAAATADPDAVPLDRHIIVDTERPPLAHLSDGDGDETATAPPEVLFETTIETPQPADGKTRSISTAAARALAAIKTNIRAFDRAAEKEG